MPDIFEMSSIAPPRQRKPKTDPLTAWDHDTLREEMAASVPQEMRKGKRFPPPTGFGANRQGESMDKVLAALTTPLTTDQLVDILDMNKRTVAHALQMLAGEGKAKREGKLGHSWLWRAM